MSLLSEPPPDLLQDAALFLDFDGTLVELAERPDTIRVPAQLGALLERLRERLEGRMAIVSGRAIADLERFLPMRDIALCGSHGLEVRRPSGPRPALTMSPGMVRAISRVRKFADDQGGLMVEEKPAGVALHFRQAPTAGQAVAAFMERLAHEERLTVQRGNMVVELRAPGADKGDAVRTLMEEPPFRGARPVFIGDDLTDEHAFSAAAELGGAGILVGPERETAARYRLPSVSAVFAWLEAQA